MTEESSVFKQEGRKRPGRFLWVVIFIVIGVFAAMLVPKAVAGYGKFVGETPEEAVKKYLEEEYPAYADGYTPLLIEEYDEFTVILYDVSDDSPGQVVFYQLVRHNVAGWYINESNSQGGVQGISPDVEIGSYIAWNIDWVSGPEYTLVYGKTLNDDVAAVEVDFQPSDQTKRVAVQDGWFLILLETRNWTHAIRALDGEGNVLAERVGSD